MFSHEQEVAYYAAFEKKYGSPLDRTQAPGISEVFDLDEILETYVSNIKCADHFYVTGITVTPPVDVDQHGIY